MKKRELTELQVAFLEALYDGDCKGDFRKALKKAGYAENISVRSVVTSLKEEIVNASLEYLALNAPKAAHAVTDLLDNPNASGATNQLKIAMEILNRAGAKPPEEAASSIKVPNGGMFILPAKQAQKILDIVYEEDSGSSEADEA